MEGYTDVTGTHQHGCENTVANCGTAPLTSIQIGMLHRFANTFISCRDNDGYAANGDFQKGILAMMRDVNIALAEGMKAMVCLLPEGEDPDSLARQLEQKRQENLSAAIEAGFEPTEEKPFPDKMPLTIQQYIVAEAQDGVLWKTKLIYDRVANDPDALADAVTEICDMLSLIKDDVKRDHYVKSCSKMMKQTPKTFKDKMALSIQKAEVKSETSGTVKLIDAETLGLSGRCRFWNDETKGLRTAWQRNLLPRSR
ncbi:toprim domain-containing protein [Flavobacterium sp. 3HN19-14]|uniref:toprim domain-containing protein n=1 Tax=Flavobacterium sp. 3HN19-14 TaxID=3448133 RepID=UPI003EE25FA3